ncbi:MULTISPECIES: TnpV protein [Oscillospiraceae]|uniref:TnpV protein n=1 Tax=Ruminococcoides intestinale TaxID=3133162 RepID=A0ABV1FDJ8_9FIRM|nr:MULTISPECIES: TnpV protein [Ruminococcus]HJI65088.1 TnpV protein [Ruminococcus bromii]
MREELKATDTTAWIGKMNNVRNRAAEVVSEEIIYK